MSVDKSAAVAKLAEYYPGVLAARAVWTWAGGDRESVPLDPPPSDQWEQLWDQSREDGGIGAVALLREALFDRPGDEALLGFLDALGQETFPDGPAAGTVLVDLITELGPGGSPDALSAALAAFPDRDGNETFAAIAPILAGKLTEADRSGLETALDGAAAGDAPSAGEYADGLWRLIDRIPELTDAAKSPDHESVAGEMKELLAPVRTSAENGAADAADDESRQDVTDMNEEEGSEVRTEADVPTEPAEAGDVDPVIEGMPPLIDRLSALADAADDPIYRAAASALGHQLDALTAVARGETPPPVADRGQAVIHGIWATNEG